jgi:peroxiredoxin/mono/diheme cytochrome c family protein
MLAAGAVLLVVGSVVTGAAPEAREAVADFRLQDARGAWHALGDARESKAVVIAFLGVECPLADQYASRLAEVARAMTPKGVAFFGVDANQQDAPSALARFAKHHDLPFPLLKDVGNELADRLGAERTPEVFVLDGKRVVRYRGRIDDQFALGVHRPTPTRRELSAALEDVLAGRPVSVPRTEAAGCRIGRVRTPEAKSDVTYSKQVARVLRDRCVSCHRPGEIAPFALTTYKQAAGWAETIAEVVADRRMPPWHASPEFGHFANDARLTDAERRLIADWVAAGAPEGDARDLPEPAPDAEGWRIPTPDLVVEMPREFEVPADGSLPYQNFVVDLGLDHDVWVRASQVRPGNPSVVHHVVAFVLPPGERRLTPDNSNILAAYSPGMPPRAFPEGVAKFVPAGARLMLQVHYTPRGTKQTDRSRVGLVFADAKSVRKQETAVMAVNFRLRIPPGAADYAAEATHRFDQDTILYALMPHMHLRGKSFRFEVKYPDGRSETLLDVPRYEFDWQNVYVLSTPKPMPEGTVIRCRGRFDNSADNPSNPDPKATVTFGEQTRDEMLVGYLDVALADQDLALGGPKVKRLGDGRSEVTFRYQLPAGTKASAVYLAGTFNDWKPDGLKMDGPDADGRYTSRLELKPGLHEYKFVLDGTRWRHDPGNARQAGYFHNSVVEVR